MEVNVKQNEAPKVTVSRSGYCLKTLQSSLNLLAHILIGIVVGGTVVFTINSGLPVGATSVHIVLCVVGYQLLTAQAVLSLCEHNGWSAHLTLVDKRRAHWILQTVGSGLAITGSVMMIMYKEVHWNTRHSQCSLVALIFTILSMINGLTSLWAYEIHKLIPFLTGRWSKLTHINFGIKAFLAAAASLCYGFNKGFFKYWAGEGVTTALIALTICLTVIIIINPCITMIKKLRCK